MAQLQAEFSKWIQKPHVKVIRFLGTTSSCRQLQKMLASICGQIAYNYGLHEAIDMFRNADIVSLAAHFNYLLSEIDFESKPLVLLLDSMDQLQESDLSTHALWIPRLLPKNVYMVFSHVVEDSKLLMSMKTIMDDDSRFLEIKPIPEKVAGAIVELWKHHYQHNLTQEQTSYLLEMYKACSISHALWLRLAFVQSLVWHSYTPRDELSLSNGIQAILNALFENIEIMHGQVLVNHAIGELISGEIYFETASFDSV